MKKLTKQKKIKELQPLNKQHVNKLTPYLFKYWRFLSVKLSLSSGQYLTDTVTLWWMNV